MNTKSQQNLFSQEELKFHRLIKDLKKLPKVKAPENFEYELMIKIQNGNFEREKIRSANSKLWGLIPASALALSVIILFFVFNENSSVDESIFNFEPISAKEIAANNSNSIELPLVGKDNHNAKVILQPNDVVKIQRKKAPLIAGRGVSVDDNIANKNNASNFSNNVRMVNMNPINSAFNGFYRRIERNKYEIKRLKAKLDSLAKTSNK